MAPSPERNRKGLLIVAIAGLVAMVAVPLLDGGPFPMWLLVGAPTAWLLFCGAILWHLERRASEELPAERGVRAIRAAVEAVAARHLPRGDHRPETRVARNRKGVLILAVAGLVSQGAAILLGHDLYPTWLMVVSPILWLAICGYVLYRLRSAT